MKKQVIPTVFARNKKEFDDKFGKLLKITRNIQIDFMDGVFVEAKSVRLDDIPSLKGKGFFEAHLMVENPESYIHRLKAKGFRKVLFHYESYNNFDRVQRLVTNIRFLGMEPFVVFNPKTSFDRVAQLSYLLKGVMFMGVNPGKENQKMNANVCRRISNLRELNKKIIIQVDGGVNDETVGALAEAGADIVNSGSFVANSRDPKKALSILEKNFR